MTAATACSMAWRPRLIAVARAAAVVPQVRPARPAQTARRKCAQAVNAVPRSATSRPACPSPRTGEPAIARRSTGATGARRPRRIGRSPSTPITPSSTRPPKVASPQRRHRVCLVDQGLEQAHRGWCHEQRREILRESPERRGNGDDRSEIRQPLSHRDA